ncbi:MAG: sigma-70 family RNA polymerase sigma factor [Planctomycetota bacterium]
MQRVLAGDPAAEDELGRRLLGLPRLLRSQNARLPRPLDEHEFRDRIQDATYALLCRLERYDGRAAIETWAFRFCAHHLLDGVRGRERRHALLGDVEVADLGEPDAMDELDALRGIDLDSALAARAADEREVVEHKHFDGATFEELGARLGISANTAKTRYYRAMLKLREHVRARHPDLFPDESA